VTRITVSTSQGVPSLEELDARAGFIHDPVARATWLQTPQEQRLESSDYVEKERREYVRLNTRNRFVGSGRLTLATTANVPADRQGGVYAYTKGRFPFAVRRDAFSVSRVMNNPEFNFRDFAPGVCLGELLYMACFAAAKRIWGARWALLVVKEDLLYSRITLESLGCRRVQTREPLLSYDMPQEPVAVVAYVADLESYSTREALGAAWSKMKWELSRLDPKVVRFPGFEGFAEFRNATPWESHQVVVSRSFSYPNSRRSTWAPAAAA